MQSEAIAAVWTTKHRERSRRPVPAIESRDWMTDGIGDAMALGCGVATVHRPLR